MRTHGNVHLSKNPKTLITEHSAWILAKSEVTSAHSVLGIFLFIKSVLQNHTWFEYCSPLTMSLGMSCNL
jgi:hypothetical protein